MKKERRVVIILSALVVLITIGAIFFSYAYTKNCSNIACFNGALQNCERASFLYDATEAVWTYNIRGLYDGKCKVNVDLIQLKQGEGEIITLEGKNMDCYLPYKSVQTPQDNLENCHGILKEEIQGFLIKRMHKYIIDHVGEISQELQKII